MVGYLGGVKAVPFQIFDKLAHRNFKKFVGTKQPVTLFLNYTIRCAKKIQMGELPAKIISSVIPANPGSGPGQAPGSRIV
jgi:hypothetical protein